MALTLTPRRVHWNARLFDGITATAVLTRSRFGPADRVIELQFGALEGGAPSPPGRGGWEKPTEVARSSRELGEGDAPSSPVWRGGEGATRALTG